MGSVQCTLIHNVPAARALYISWMYTLHAGGSVEWSEGVIANKMYKELGTEKTALIEQTFPAISVLKLNLKKMKYDLGNCDEEIEEPVSPPACDPDEGPPLLCSQPIEDIAMEVIDENAGVNAKKAAAVDIDNIPKTIELEQFRKQPSPLHSIIPLTVSEMSKHPKHSPNKSPPTLHMSGGMVSTDISANSYMSLQITSEPSSFTTISPFNHHLVNTERSPGMPAIEDKSEQSVNMDNILQYLMEEKNRQPNFQRT